jgi:NADPH:quinone reductase-like Zn-dependent oxidoreductase
MAKKMRAVQVSKAKGPLEVVEREIPEPKSGWVRVKVEACGVCHSDSLTKDGLWPGIQFPRIPGHEVIGVIDAVGPDVPDWKSVSGSALGGTLHIVGIAIRVGAVISLPARWNCSQPESLSTAVIPNTWSHRRKRWRLCRTI